MSRFIRLCQETVDEPNLRPMNPGEWLISYDYMGMRTGSRVLTQDILFNFGLDIFKPY